MIALVASPPETLEKHGPYFPFSLVNASYIQFRTE